MKWHDHTTPVYLWQGAVDMRMSFDRLASLVQEEMAQSVIRGGLYLFFSRCRKRVKLLYWDRDGYAMWHKRLEAGSYRVTREEGSLKITSLDMEAILAGTDFSRILLGKNAERGSYD